MSDQNFKTLDGVNALLRLQQDLALKTKLPVQPRDLTISVDVTEIRSQSHSAVPLASGPTALPSNEKMTLWTNINGGLYEVIFNAELA